MPNDSERATGPPEEDVAFCRKVLPSVSRTFAIPIERLTPPLRRAVRTAYLLCRVVDTVEDEAGLELAVREQLFDEFDAALAGSTSDWAAFETHANAIELGAGSPDRPLIAECTRAFRVFRELPERDQLATQPWIAEMSGGMRSYCRRPGYGNGRHITDVRDLERYCYYVAGTVGELLTALFVAQCALESGCITKARQLGVRFGLGLQLVNIIKDVGADETRGVSFLPAQAGLLAQAGLPTASDPHPDPSAQRHSLCERARSHLDVSLEYVTLWKGEAGLPIREFCLIPLVLAFGTLDVLQNTRGPRLKLTRPEVVRLLDLAFRTARDLGSLAGLPRETQAILGD